MIQKIFAVISAQTASRKLHVVSSVPFYWSSKQTESLKSCLFRAGFNPLQMVRQHAASILALNLDNCPKTQRVMVIDFGTFCSTLSVLSVVNGLVIHKDAVHCKSDTVSGMAVDLMLL